MRLRRLHKITLTVAIAIGMVGSGSAAGWALWNSTNTVSGSASAATIGITANGADAASLSGVTTAGEGPGTTMTTPITVANTGSLALSYSASMVATETPSGAAIGDNITYTVWVATAASSCTNSGTVGTTSWTGNLNTGTKTLGTGRALAAGGTEVLCIRTVMSTKAPTTIQGQSVSSVITFTGTGSGWSDSATASFSQATQSMPTQSYSSCTTDLPGNDANLTWPAAPATLNGSAFKDYYIEWIYSSGRNSGTTILTATRTSPYAQPMTTGMTGNSFVRVTYEYANGWTSQPLPNYTFVPSTNGNASPVCSPELASK